MSDLAPLRANQFEVFMEDRQKRLLAPIEQAMGKAAYTGNVPEEEEDIDEDEESADAALTVASA